MKKTPFLKVDETARQLAASLLHSARIASLGVLDPETRTPYVSRIAITMGPAGHMISLLSALAHHSRALAQDPACSLLIGEPPAKGDPLAFARLSLAAKAHFPPREETEMLRTHYLKSHPKAKLYADFPDFRFVVFMPEGALLNGGFGKAFKLAPEDLPPG